MLVVLCAASGQGMILMNCQRLQKQVCKSKVLLEDRRFEAARNTFKGTADIIKSRTGPGIGGSLHWRTTRSDGDVPPKGDSRGWRQEPRGQIVHSWQ